MSRFQQMNLGNDSCALPAVLGALAIVQKNYENFLTWQKKITKDFFSLYLIKISIIWFKNILNWFLNLFLK